MKSGNYPPSGTVPAAAPCLPFPTSPFPGWSSFSVGTSARCRVPDQHAAGLLFYKCPPGVAELLLASVSLRGRGELTCLCPGRKALNSADTPGGGKALLLECGCWTSLGVLHLCRDHCGLLHQDCVPAMLGRDLDRVINYNCNRRFECAFLR